MNGYQTQINDAQRFAEKGDVVGSDLRLEVAEEYASEAGIPMVDTTKIRQIARSKLEQLCGARIPWSFDIHPKILRHA